MLRLAKVVTVTTGHGHTSDLIRPGWKRSFSHKIIEFVVGLIVEGAVEVGLFAVELLAFQALDPFAEEFALSFLFVEGPLTGRRSTLFDRRSVRC